MRRVIGQCQFGGAKCRYLLGGLCQQVIVNLLGAIGKKASSSIYSSIPIVECFILQERKLPN